MQGYPNQPFSSATLSSSNGGAGCDAAAMMVPGQSMTLKSSLIKNNRKSMADGSLDVPITSKLRFKKNKNNQQQAQQQQQQQQPLLNTEGPMPVGYSIERRHAISSLDVSMLHNGSKAVKKSGSNQNDAQNQLSCSYYQEKSDDLNSSTLSSSSTTTSDSNSNTNFPSIQINESADNFNDLMVDECHEDDEADRQDSAEMSTRHFPAHHHRHFANLNLHHHHIGEELFEKQPNLKPLPSPLSRNQLINKRVLFCS